MSVETNGNDNQGPNKNNLEYLPLRVMPGEPIPLLPDPQNFADPDADSVFYTGIEVEGIGKGHIIIDRVQFMKPIDTPLSPHTPTGDLGLEDAVPLDDLEEVPKILQPYEVRVYLDDMNAHQMEHVTVDLKVDNETTGEIELYEGEPSFDEDELNGTGYASMIIDRYYFKDPNYNEMPRRVFFAGDHPKALQDGKVHVIIDELKGSE